MLPEHQDNPSECFMAGKSKVVESMNLGRIKHE